MQRADLSVDRPLFSVHFLDAQRGVAVGLWSLVLVTADGGAHWQEVKPPKPPGRRQGRPQPVRRLRRPRGHALRRRRARHRAALEGRGRELGRISTPATRARCGAASRSTTAASSSPACAAASFAATTTAPAGSPCLGHQELDHRPAARSGEALSASDSTARCSRAPTAGAASRPAARRPAGADRRARRPRAARCGCSRSRAWWRPEPPEGVARRWKISLTMKRTGRRLSPATPDVRLPFPARLLIDGRWIERTDAGCSTSSTRPTHACSAACRWPGRPRCRRRRRRRHAPSALVAHAAAGALSHHQPATALLRERASEIARMLTLEQGKPLAEALREVTLCGRHHRLPRRGGEAPRRARHAAARAQRAEPDGAARAGRPGGRLHAVELPGQPAGAQARRRARRGLQRGHQAGRGDAGDLPRDRARLRGCRAARGRAERRRRRSGVDLAGADRAPGDRQGLLHRLDRRRPAARREGGAAPEALHRRARRPCAGDRLRRCRPDRRGQARGRAPSSAARARSAPRRSASWCSARSSRRSATPSSPPRARSRSATGSRRACRWARSSPSAACSAMQSLVDDAIRQGARLLAGGRRLDGPGFFYPPTVLEGASAGCRVQREEPFGPIALLDAFDDLDDAIARANALALWPRRLRLHARARPGAPARRRAAGRHGRHQPLRRVAARAALRRAEGKRHGFGERARRACSPTPT